MATFLFICSFIYGSIEYDCSPDTLPGMVAVYFIRPPPTRYRKTETLGFIPPQPTHQNCSKQDRYFRCIFCFPLEEILSLRLCQKYFARDVPRRFCVTGQSPFLLIQSPIFCLWSFLFHSQCKLCHTRKLGLV